MPEQTWQINVEATSEQKRCHMPAKVFVENFKRLIEINQLTAYINAAVWAKNMGCSSKLFLELALGLYVIYVMVAGRRRNIE